MPEPFPVNEISADTAALRNSVIGTRRSIRWSMNQTPLELRFSHQECCDAGMLLQVSAGPAQFWIGLADWDRVPGVTELLDGGRVSSLPPDVLPVVLEAVFEEPLDRLSKLASARFEILSATGSAPDPDSSSRVAFSIAFEQEPPLPGFIAGDPAAMNFLRYLIELAPAEPAEGVELLPLESGIEIGVTELPLSQLAELKLHDVIMMDSNTIQEQPEGIVRFSPTCAWRVSISDNRAVCLRREERPQTVNVAGDDVSVLVAIEQGRVRCTVDQLTQLGPDTSLEISDAGSILLTSNGKPFAAGELVQIGDRLGVRLLSRPTSVPLAEAEQAGEVHPLDHREV